MGKPTQGCVIKLVFAVGSGSSLPEHSVELSRMCLEVVRPPERCRGSPYLAVLITFAFLLDSCFRVADCVALRGSRVMAEKSEGRREREPVREEGT